MENQNVPAATPTPAANPAGPPAAGVPPPYVPPPTAAEPPPVDGPKYAAGGFLKQFDWVDIGFMALGVFAIYTIINHYRKKAKEEPKIQQTLTDVQSRLEKTEKQLNAIGGANRRRM